MTEVVVKKKNIQLDDEEIDELHFERLVLKRKQVFDSLLVNKEKALTETRDIPLHMLAIEWFNKIDASIETRAYLVENFLPMLVLGCEKVLKDAQKKGLVDQNKKDSDFNPINLLAQYLMRNNPKYNNHNETSAYVRTMREIYHQLREQMFAFQENKLAKVKADIRQRRLEREVIEKTRRTENQRRSDKLQALFSNWHINPSGRIEIAIVLQALNLYSANISRLSAQASHPQPAMANLKALPSYCFTRDGISLTKRLMRDEFAQCLLAVSEHLSSELFDIFVEFLTECAAYFVVKANRKRLNKILKCLFQLVDSTNTGFLTRQRVFQLLNEFVNKKANAGVREQLSSTENWPLIDPCLKFEKGVLNSEGENTNLASEEETMGEETTEPVVSEVIDGEGEKEAVATEEVDEGVKELVDGKVGGEDGEIVSDEVKTDVEGKVDVERSETKKSVEMTLSVNAETEENLPVKAVISKENELLFLNGGILYYKPLESELNAFDTDLISEQSRNPRVLSARSNRELKKADQRAFDIDLLDTRQFLNLVGTFMRPGLLDSEEAVNELVVFLKDNYAENMTEKNAKLEKLAFEKKFYAQRERIGNCFEKLDNEGARCLSLEYITSALDGFKDGMFKDQVQQATDTLKEKIQVNGREDEVIYKDDFIGYILDLIRIADFAKFEDQLMNYLNGFLMPAAKAKSRGESRKVWLSQIEKVGDLTFGSLEPLYKQMFATLLKDTETHGNNKTLSAYIAVLETVGEGVGLKYQASTPYDSRFVLGKTVTRQETNVSFGVIDSGRFLKLESVRANPKVHYFDQSSQKDGMLVVYPLKYSRNKTFGVIGLDTLQEKDNQLLSDTELQFYQGVANTFAKAYTGIVFKNRMAKTLLTACDWLSQRVSSIEMFNVYVVQMFNSETSVAGMEAGVNSLGADSLGGDTGKLNLRPVMKYLFRENGIEDIMDVVSDNIGQHLYECAATSESTVDVFNSRTFYSFPVRNEKQNAVFVVELISKEQPETFKRFTAELEIFETVIYVLDMCQKELLEEMLKGSSDKQYDFENQFENEKFEILFEKKYLKLVIERLGNLVDKKLVELLPDGTESPETSNTRKLFKLVSDMTACPIDDQIISRELIEKLTGYDTTYNGFKYKNSQVTMTMEDLNLLYVSLGLKNNGIRALVDWVCLNRNMKIKVDKVKKHLGRV